MKRKDIQAIFNMSAGELEKKIAESRRKFSELNFAHTAGKLNNPHEKTAVRKLIARMLTAVNMKDRNNDK